MDKLKIEDLPLDKLFDYRDGNLYWKKRDLSEFATETAGKVFNTRAAGKLAGTVERSNGYREIRIYGKTYLAHRIIFYMFYGYLPEMVDHIDRDIFNNKIENLRAATRSQNSANSKLNRNNKSGVKGVYKDKSSGKWIARMKFKGKQITLGKFDSIAEAAVVRINAATNKYKEFAHNAMDLDKALRGEHE